MVELALILWGPCATVTPCRPAQLDLTSRMDAISSSFRTITILITKMAPPSKCHQRASSKEQQSCPTVLVFSIIFLLFLFFWPYLLTRRLLHLASRAQMSRHGAGMPLACPSSPA